MTISVAGFKALFTEFTAYSDDMIQSILDCVLLNVDPDVFGGCYERAVYLLLAHNVTMQGRGAAVGAITSESVGSLSRSYGSSPTSGSSLSLTGYGVQYQSLVKLYCSGGSIIC